MNKNEQNSSSLQEMIRDIKIMRYEKLPINWDNCSAIYSLYSEKFTAKTFNPIIINWNVNKLNRYKMEFLKEKIITFKPDIIFLSECWIIPENLTTYIKFVSNDFYRNTLYIKSNILRNRSVIPIDRGFLFEDLCFRYVPPSAGYINLKENEIGDYNFMSHSWIDHRRFNKEKRDMKIGGLGSKLIYPHDVKFLDSLSDHDMEIIRIRTNWKKILKVDMRKLENALKASLITGKLEYFYSDQSIKSYKSNSRIVNPNIIEFSQWEKIYGNEKNPNLQFKPHIVGNNKITQPFGTMAYDDDQIPLKPITKFIVKNELDLNDTQKLINVLQKHPSIGRIVSILKKHHKLEDIKDIRPVCILPVAMRLVEQTRSDLCNLPVSDFIYGFRPDNSVHNLFKHFFGNLNRKIK